MENKNRVSSSGIGFGGVLQITFIVLKLCGVIDWSWIWVLAPLWISVAFVVLMLIIFYLIFVRPIVKLGKDNDKRWRKRR